MPDLITYIEASVAAERERQKAKLAAQRKRFRLAMGAAGVMLVLAIASGVVGFVAYEKSIEATKNLAEAKRSQSNFLAKVSREVADTRTSSLGMLLALKALPDDLRNTERPYVAAAEVSLNYALNAHYERRDIAVLEGHKSAVIHADFSPDDRRIVTASGDDTTRLWDAVTRETVAVLEGHERSVFHAAFSPDGTRIVTASNANTARIYPVYSLRELIKVARARVGRELTTEERKEFFLE